MCHCLLSGDLCCVKNGLIWLHVGINISIADVIVGQYSPQAIKLEVLLNVTSLLSLHVLSVSEVIVS